MNISSSVKVDKLKVGCLNWSANRMVSMGMQENEIDLGSHIDWRPWSDLVFAVRTIFGGRLLRIGFLVIKSPRSFCWENLLPRVD